MAIYSPTIKKGAGLMPTSAPEVIAFRPPRFSIENSRQRQEHGCVSCVYHVSTHPTAKLWGTRPEDWIWSSYRYYAGYKNVVLTIDIAG